MAQVELTVGVDAVGSQSGFTSGIESLVNGANANPLLIKIQIDPASLSSARKDIESLLSTAGVKSFSKEIKNIDLRGLSSDAKSASTEVQKLMSGLSNERVAKSTTRRLKGAVKDIKQVKQVIDETTGAIETTTKIYDRKTLKLKEEFTDTSKSYRTALSDAQINKTAQSIKSNVNNLLSSLNKLSNLPDRAPVESYAKSLKGALSEIDGALSAYESSGNKFALDTAFANISTDIKGLSDGIKALKQMNTEYAKLGSINKSVRSNVNTLSSSLSKLSNIPDRSAIEAYDSALKNVISDLEAASLAYNSSGDKFALDTSLTNISSNLKDLSDGVKLLKQLDTEYARLDVTNKKIETSMGALGAFPADSSDSFTARADEVTNGANAMRDSLNRLNAAAADTSSAGVNGFRDGLGGYTESFNDFNSGVEGFTQDVDLYEKSVRQLISASNVGRREYRDLQKFSDAETYKDIDIQKMYGNWQNAFAEFASEYDSFQSKVSGGSATQEDINRMASAILNLQRVSVPAKEEFAKLGLGTQTLGEKVKSLFKILGTRLPIQMAVMTAIRAVKQLVSSSIEINSAMTQMRIVTNASASDMEKFAETASAAAKRVGSSITDFTSSATTYARLGYSMNESALLAEYTAMIQNVGDIDVSDAQSAVTAIVKAFSDEIDISNIESVMDKLVTVGNNFPISVSEIATGMNNASSALSAAGNNFEQSVALLTAANTTIQDAAKSSTGLRTIAARLRNTKTELDDIGETMTTAEYGEIVAALTKYNVSLTDTNGELRSTYDIMADISNIWDTLSANQQAALAETLSGTRQQAVFYSLIENFKEASGAMDAMSESAGALDSAYSAYMESTQYHIDKFKAAFEELSSVAIDSQLTSEIVDLGSTIIEILSGVLKLIDALGGMRTALVGVAGVVAVLKLNTIIDKIGAFQSKLMSFQTVISSFRGMNLGSLINTISLGLRQLVTVTDSASTSLVVMGSSANAAAAGLNAMQVAIGAIALVIAGISFVSNKIKEIREHAASVARADISEIQEMNAKSDAIISAYSEYVKYANIQNRTEEQEELMSSALQQTISLLEGKASVLSRLTEGTQSYANELTNVIEKELKLQNTNSSKQQADAGVLINNARTEIVHKNKDHLYDLTGQFIQDEIEMVTNSGNPEFTKKITEAYNTIRYNIGDVDKAIGAFITLSKAQDILAESGHYSSSEYAKLVEVLQNVSEGSEQAIRGFYEQSKAQFQLENGVISSSEAYQNFHSILVDTAMEKYDLDYLSAEDFVSGLEATDSQITNLASNISSATEDIEKSMAQSIRSIQSQLKGYDNLSESVDGLIDSMDHINGKFADHSHLSEETYNSIKSLVGGEEELSKCVDSSNGYLVLNSEKLQTLIRSAENATLANIDLAKSHERFNYHKLVGQLYSVVTATEDYNSIIRDNIDSILNQIDGVETQIQKYELLKQKILGATSAFDEYNKAKEFDKETDYTDDFSEMLSGVLSVYSDGTESSHKWGTEGFQTAFDALIPDNIYERLKGAGDKLDAGYKYINDVLSKYITIESDDDGVFKNVSLTEKNIESFVKDGLANGAFKGSIEDFDLSPDISTLKEFADAMGVTETSAFALANALSQYSADHEDFLQNLSEPARKAYEEFKEREKELKAVEDKKSTQKVTDAATESWRKFVSVDGVDGAINAVDESLESLLKKRVELSQTREDTKEWKQQWEDVNTQIEQTKEHYKTLAINAREQISANIEFNSNISEKQEEVSSLYKKLQSLDKEDPKYSATLENYEQAVDELGVLLEKKEKLGEPTETTITVAINDINSEIDETKQKLDTLAAYDGTTNTYTAKANTKEAQAEVDALAQKLSNLQAEKHDIETYAHLDSGDVKDALDAIEGMKINDKEFHVYGRVGEALATIQLVIDELDRIPKKKDVYITTYKQTVDKGTKSGTILGTIGKIFGISGADGTAHLQGHNVVGNAYERGTWGIPQKERQSLVGELGAEIVVEPHSGKYYTVGDNGAEFVDLPKGSIIFNHVQTRELLKNKHINSRGKAYAEGNAHFGLVTKSYNIKSVGGASSGNSGSKISSTGSSKSKTSSIKADSEFEKQYRYHQHLVEMNAETDEAYLKWLNDAYKKAYKNNQIELEDYYKYEEEVYKGLQDLYNDHLSDVEHNISLKEYYNETSNDIIVAYQKLIKDVENEITTAKKQGLKDTDDYIQSLQDKWVSYNKALQDLFNEQLSDIEHSISIKQNYSGQGREIIGIYKKLIKKVEKEIAAARKRGLSNESDYIQGLIDKWEEYNKAVKELRKDALEGAKDSLDELVEYRMDMLKQDKENEKDNLNKRLDAYREFIDKQKELLQDEYDEDKYLEDQAEKRKSVSEIREKLEQLKYDDSAWAQKRRVELEKDLADAQKELDDFEKEHALEEALDALDKDLELQEKSIESQIEGIENYIDNPERLYNQALQEITSNSRDILAEMIAYNRKYGSGNDQDIYDMWDEVYNRQYEYRAATGENYQNWVMPNSNNTQLDVKDGMNVDMSGKWRYYKDGYVDTSYTGMAKNDYGWWYMKNGTLDYSYNGLAKNEYGTWKMKNGALDTSYTGMYKDSDGTWKYINKGKYDTSYTGLAKNDYGWWYMKNGNLDKSYTGMAKNQYGWWYVKNGKVDTTYTGTAKNQYGTWQFKDGKIVRQASTSTSSSSSSSKSKVSSISGNITSSSSASSIKALQSALKSLGYKGADGKALTVDGIWGNNTAYAVKQFQSKNGLTADGIVGAQTKAKFKVLGYASGTKNASRGLHEVEELGAEYLFTSKDGNRYRLFSGGEKVLDAKSTDFLYNFAKSKGLMVDNVMFSIDKIVNSLLPSIRKIGKDDVPTSINMGDIIVQGNADRATVSEIRRAQRESLETVLKEFNRLSKQY